MSEENPTPEEKAAEEAKAARLAEVKAKVKEDNETRSGVGTRLEVSQVRGRTSGRSDLGIITYEAWDFENPDTLVKSLDAYMAYRKVNDLPDAETFIVNRLMRGDNEIALETASDPIAEFVDLSWPKEFQDRFRLVIRNYSTGAGVSIQDAVSLIKPGIDAAAKAAKAAVVPAGAK